MLKPPLLDLAFDLELEAAILCYLHKLDKVDSIQYDIHFRTMQRNKKETYISDINTNASIQ